VAYSYLMYVVAPFNDVFLLYVAAIGLASYGLLNGLVRLDIRAAATGILLFRGHAAGPVLASLLLVKMVILGLALLFMNAFVWADTGSANAGESVIWALVEAVAAGWLIAVFRRMQSRRDAWLRPTLWP
jgi:hypothetical protein